MNKIKLPYSFFIYCMISVLIVVVFFGDFIGLTIGLYAERRFALIFFSLFIFNSYFFGGGGALRTCMRSRVLYFGGLGIAFWGFFIFCSSGLLSQFYTSGPWSWVELLYYFLYFSCTFFLSRHLLCFGNDLGFLSYRKFVPFLIVVGGFFYAIITIPIYFYAISDKFTEFSSVMLWGFVSIRYWSHVATWMIPLLPLAALIDPPRWQRLWQGCVWVTASIWWWLVFLSAARGTICAIVISGLVIIFVFRRAAKKWISMSLGFAASGFLVWLVLSVLVPYMLWGGQNVAGVDLSSAGRMPLWKEAFAMSLQHFPLGMGAQSWLTHETLTKAYAASFHFGHPHNMYLMWAAEYGWLSILGILLVVYGLGLRLVKKAKALQGANSFDSMVMVSLAGSAVAGAIHAAVSAVFIAPASMILGLLVLAMFLAELSYPLPQADESGRLIPEWSGGMRESLPRKRRLGVFALVFSLSLLWFYGVVAYYHAMRADIPFYQGHLKMWMEPRFWFHGNFPRPPKLMPPPQTD